MWQPTLRRTGAVASATVAVLLTAAAAYITYGLSASYGFGSGWDWSSILMISAVAALVASALLAAVRLARMRWRALPLLAASIATVFAIWYVAGVLGNHVHR